MRYLIISYENLCVYALVDSPIIANAIAGSSIDTFVRAITPTSCPDYELCTEEYFQNNVLKVATGKGNIMKSSEEEVSKEWLVNREILKARYKIFKVWESYTANALIRVQRYQWSGFTAVASSELEKCDLANNKYTIMIEEFARVVDLPIDQFCKDLRLKLEADNITKFRITALAEKWKTRINNSRTRQELTSIVPEMFQEFNSNSFI